MPEHQETNGIVYDSKIHTLCFYVLGDEEILGDSNVNVTNKDIMKGTTPTPNGLYDAHMGTTDFKWGCKTCLNAKNQCPGHFGSMQLKYPIKSPMYRDELLKWLKVVCYHCGALVAEPANVPAARKLSTLVKAVKSVTDCPNCGKPHQQVIKDKKRPFIFQRVLKASSAKQQPQITEMYNHHIKRVLERISNETVLRLGKPLSCHPKNFILTCLPVSPNTMRPDIRRIGGNRSSNSDTTNLLKLIFEINDVLPSEIPADEEIAQQLKDSYSNLDMACYSMIKGGGGGEVKIVANTSKTPMAIAERFPKKQGRIRRNLMGKRVAYMIRSVIIGDPYLAVNEVGVPLIHARDLEIPERVTSRNIAKLQKYFLNGDKIYPGCKHVIRTVKIGDKYQQSVFRRQFLKEDYVLQIGDIVMRDMITGDCICFNRQPSLLFSNVASMRVVVMETGNTLRLNPSACNLFNADFDGDNMNSIVGQNIMSRNECMMISKVARWLISPQTHAPLIGAFQDGLIGIFELSKHGLEFNKWHAMQLYSNIHDPLVDYRFKDKLYSNRQLISRLLPKINISNKTPSFYKSQYANFLKYKPEDIKVNIVRGQLMNGVIDKAIAGQDVAGSIIHIIANEYGNDRALDTIYNLQQIVHKFLGYHGFTVGISDINVSEAAMKEIKKNLTTIVLNSRKITQRLNNGKLIAPLGVSMHDFYESEQLNALQPGDDFVNAIFSDIDIETNQMARLILSGSKGKTTNFVALNGAIGVQTINGKRFGHQAGWGRTSPYFVRYDTEPDANGFISMSFREGVRNDVYAFMAGEARHGLISNALSTSVTGYQNRISIKNLESIFSNNMRASSKGNNIIQPLYAECGIDPSKLEKVKFPTIMISDAEFEAEYRANTKDFDKKFATNALDKLLKEEFEQLKADREYYRSVHLRLEAHNPKEYIMDSSKQMPVNIYRIIEDTVYNYDHVVNGISKDQRLVDPKYIIEKVRDFCTTIGYVYMNDLCRKANRPIPKYIQLATKLMQILLRSYLCSKQMAKKHICNSLLDIILQHVLSTYKKSLIEYGTAVGIFAAQCVCQQFTQYVLDSKHRTGGQGGTKTNAIIRMQEILGAKPTESMKHPHMLIMVKPEYEENKLKVQEIANYIEMMTLGRFISSMTIFFEKYGKPLHPKYVHEAKIIEEFERHNFGVKVPGDLANWCVRYELNKEEMILKSMSLETIVLALKKKHPEVFVVHNSENNDDIVLRVYLRNSMFKQTTDYYNDSVLYIANELKKVVVRGVNGIISTIVVDVMRHDITADGSLQMKKIYGIMSAGTNLTDIISNPYVDAYRTQSDSIEEMQRVFGLVAARNKIINEMLIALEGLNRIHCSVFADEMCFSGQVSNIQKTGLQKRENANVSLRISFQTAIQVIQNAAINGLADNISGISGPLIMGTSPSIGTTYNQVVVNQQFLDENAKSFDSVLEDL